MSGKISQIRESLSSDETQDASLSLVSRLITELSLVRIEDLNNLVRCTRSCFGLLHAYVFEPVKFGNKFL
jgi:hypothetical protein